MNIFIKDKGDGEEWTCRKFSDDTKPGRMTDEPKGCAGIQRDLDRLENWDNRLLNKFKKEKCKVLYPGGINSHAPGHTRAQPTGKQLCRKGPEGLHGHQVDL